MIAKYTIARRQECISRDAVGELLEEREAAVNFFLEMYNGDWTVPCAIHVCPGPWRRRDQEDAADKMFAAAISVDLLLGHDVDPPQARTTGCSATARLGK